MSNVFSITRKTERIERKVSGVEPQVPRDPARARIERWLFQLGTR